MKPVPAEHPEQERKGKPKTKRSGDTNTFSEPNILVSGTRFVLECFVEGCIDLGAASTNV